MSLSSIAGLWSVSLKTDSSKPTRSSLTAVVMKPSI